MNKKWLEELLVMEDAEYNSEKEKVQLQLRSLELQLFVYHLVDQIKLLSNRNKKLNAIIKEFIKTESKKDDHV